MLPIRPFTLDRKDELYFIGVAAVVAVIWHGSRSPDISLTYVLGFLTHDCLTIYLKRDHTPFPWGLLRY